MIEYSDAVGYVLLAATLIGITAVCVISEFRRIDRSCRR